ncbi:hypothetical protein RJZ90_003998 [Blastomyces dermatitidis]
MSSSQSNQLEQQQDSGKSLRFLQQLHKYSSSDTMRPTIERLDKPSAYYLSKNKRRKFGDRDGPQEDPVDPLKDATTLYVGNLYVYTSTR